MTPQDETRIREWHASIENRIEIKFFQTNSHIDDLFLGFCRNLAECAPDIDIRTETDTSVSMPEIRISDQLRYSAIPEGPELDPFLSALEGQHSAPEPIPEEIRASLDRLSFPAYLTLYITPSCPYCPAVVRQLIMLTRNSRHVHVSIIDGTLFPQPARENGIQSAPTLLFDLFRWTGKVPFEEVVAAIADRDPLSLSSDTLSNIIHDGAADKVARMMLEKGRIFPSLMPILCHEKWPERLGAMVVMETIIDADPDLAAQAVGPLCEIMDTLDDPVKGDLLYILGEIGDPGALPVIRDIMARTENDEVRSAAAEALDAIRGVDAVE